MNIDSTIHPSYAFIYNSNDTASVSNQTGRKTATETEGEWLDLTKTADATYSYVSEQSQTMEDSKGWTYDMSGKLNELVETDNSVSRSLIDVWA